MDRLSYGLLQKILDLLSEENFQTDRKQNETYQSILTLMDTVLEKKNVDESDFTRRVIHIWNNPLFHLESFISISKDVLGLFLSDVIPEQDFELHDVIRRMHGRACLVSEEVLLLLKNGYADGAMSRWRSLHEINVMTKFIHKNGNKMAQRYIDYEAIESKQILDKYILHEKKLRLSPMSSEEIREIEKEVEIQIEHYGKDFSDINGWAREVFPKKNISIARIEKEVNLEHMRPYYQMACHSIHAGIKGIRFQLGLVTYDRDHILTGQTDMGLADPGILTVFSLNNMNKMILKYIEQEKSLQVGTLLDSLEEEIKELFFAIHQIQDGVPLKDI